VVGLDAAMTADLEALRQAVKQCYGCGLSRGRCQTVFGEGRGDADLMFIGEGPGADEDQHGVPFVGRAGQLLDRMLAAMEVARSSVYITNIVKCHPPRNRDPLPDEVSACRAYLDQQIRLVQPQIIVVLGAPAAKTLLNTTAGIGSLRGRWAQYAGGIMVMPTFHPAYLLRNAKQKAAVWQDLQLVIAEMDRRGIPRGRR
jgi:uracil-DNA glycosylase